MLVDYCRLLIVVHKMSNIKATSVSDVWNGKTVELHNMPVCIGLLESMSAYLFVFVHK